mmetsp:Transcript_14540/g.24051  ORF Transcript_14540/g.24051 Transcript_14540/m.24051 type:complete len:818 (+) Transcript_14540:372-2825(+)
MGWSHILSTRRRFALVIFGLVYLSCLVLASTDANPSSDVTLLNSVISSSLQRPSKSACPNMCSSRGLCFAGACVCDPGFFGSDCSEGGFGSVGGQMSSEAGMRAQGKRLRAKSSHRVDSSRLPSMKEERSLAICLVVSSSADSTGVSHQVLAESLAKQGHNVHILLAPGATDVSAEARDGLNLAVTRLPPSDLRYPSLHMAHSFDVYSWLRIQEFDVVNFLDGQHIPYFSLLAKRQEVAFARTAIVVVVDAVPHSSHYTNLPGSIDALESEFMERQSLEMADALIGARVDAVPKGLTMPTDSFFDGELFHPMNFFSVSQRWNGFQKWVANEHASEEEALPSSASDTPLVTVAMVHRNRPAFLKQAIASIQAQDYPNFEVVLVDDGSDQAEAISLLNELESDFSQRGWRIVRQENKYLGAARNAAAKLARGEYLLFMDDDNIAKPHEISTLVRAARKTGADVLTSFVSFFTGKSHPQADDENRPPFLFLGGAAGIGAFRNVYGDANAMVKTATFFELGGFTEDFGVGYEDWEFFAKATMTGKHMQVVPEALYWYRFTPGSMQRSTQPRQNRDRSLRPYLDKMPNSLKNLLGSSQDAVGAVGSAPQLEKSSSNSRRLLEFYGFYGFDFYGYTVTPTPAPAASSTVDVTLNMTCAKFTATSADLVKWAASYLKVPLTIVVAKTNCPSSKGIGLLSVDAVSTDPSVIVSFTIFDLTYGTSSWPGGSSSSTLAKAIQSADSILGIAVVNPRQLATDGTPAAAASGGSALLAAYVAIPVALVAAIVVASAVVGTKIYRKRRAGFAFAGADMSSSQVDDNVIYV